MNDPQAANDSAVNRWLSQENQRFLAELHSLLKIEAGLRDALLPAAHLAFAADLDAVLDIERGLIMTLPDDSATPTASVGLEDDGPNAPHAPGPAGAPSPDEPADVSAPPPPRSEGTQGKRDRHRPPAEEEWWSE
jgi:hypothetical protein